jgi:LPS-assembly protein
LSDLSLDIGRRHRKPLLVSRISRISLFVLAGAGLSGLVLTSAHAQQGPSRATGVELTADSGFRYDDKIGDLVATENARLSYDGWLLTANEIRFNETTGEAFATGDVVIMKEAYRLVADWVRYWPSEKRAELTRFRLGQPPVHVAGEHAKGMIDSLAVEDADVYYGEPDRLAPRATADEIRYFKDGQIEADRLIVRLGVVPVFFGPGISGSVDIGDYFLEGSLGYSSDLGVFAGVGIGVGIGSGIDLGGSLETFSKRGLLWGPLVRYRPRINKNWPAGDLRFRTIDDHGNRGIDAIGRPIDAQRYIGEWKHFHEFGSRTSLTILANVWSDSEVTRDFRPSLFDKSQQPDNTLEAAYRGSNYIMSLFSRCDPNEFYPVTERLPEVRFDLMPTNLGYDLLHEVQLSAAKLEFRNISDNTRTRSDRLDAYYGISRAITPNKWLTLTPVAGGRVTYYGKTVDDSNHTTRWLGEIGFDADIKSFATFDIENKIWQINGLRHLVNTKIQYRYIPDADKGKEFIPVIDREVFSTALEPISLAEIRPILDNLNETNILRIGFDNILQTRHEEYGSRDLINFYLAGDIHFSKRPGDDDFSSIYAFLGLAPAPWLQCKFFTRLNPNRHLRVEELNTEVWLIDQEYWQVGLGTEFLINQFEQYTLNARYRINDTFSLYTSLRYDAKTSILNELSVRVAQNIHDLWVIEYGFTAYDGSRRLSGNRVEFGIKFLGF